MKIYLYICFLFSVIGLVFLLIYNDNSKKLPVVPLIVNTASVTKVEIIYGYEKGAPKKREIKFSDFDKALSIIKSCIVSDAKPQKSCPWVDFVLHKNGKRIYLNLLLRNSDIMIQAGKKSWLIPRKNKNKLIKFIKELLSDSE